MTAIDLDEISTSFNPIALLRTLRVNGPVRFAKTCVRKLVGFDRRFLREVFRQRPLLSGSRPQVLREDAAKTSLGSASFDCAMSISVLRASSRSRSSISRDPAITSTRRSLASHHSSLLERFRRTRRPGLRQGSFRFSVLVHLRPTLQHLSTPNCYVNKLSLAQWKSLIETECPDAKVTSFSQDHPTEKNSIGCGRPGSSRTIRTLSSHPMHPGSLEKAR